MLDIKWKAEEDEQGRPVHRAQYKGFTLTVCPTSVANEWSWMVKWDGGETDGIAASVPSAHEAAERCVAARAGIHVPAGPDIELARRIVHLLNEAYALDPVAVHALVEYRVQASEALAAHPTIQVIDDSPPVVGMLGFFNGLVGADKSGWGLVAAVFDDEEKLIRFELRQ